MLAGFIQRCISGRDHLAGALTGNPSIATLPRSVVGRTGPDSVKPCRALGPPSTASVKRRRALSLQHHTAREHALLLVQWIQRNIEPSSGMIFREAIREFYVEAILESSWAPRAWNPIARELDLLCTGGKKPYQWAADDRGRMRRRRHYHIPDLLADIAHATSERRAA
jgi:hypothetical protein